MKYKGLKLEEIESLHTLGGVGTGCVQGRGKGRGYIEFVIRGKGRTKENTYKWVSV
jgi:hypothetical protein